VNSPPAFQKIQKQKHSILIIIIVKFIMDRKVAKVNWKIKNKFLKLNNSSVKGIARGQILGVEVGILIALLDRVSKNWMVSNVKIQKLPQDSKNLKVQKKQYNDC